jgi:hypothetical protein
MATMPLPMIRWPASSPTNTLNFTYPPVEKPGIDDEEGVRVDSVTLSGLKQSMWYRTDIFRHVILKFVPMADLANWKSFFDYALQGGSFLYYPDSTLAVYDEWQMEDSGGSMRNQTQVSSSGNAGDAWNPTYSFRGITQFSLVMRKVPGGLSSP